MTAYYNEIDPNAANWLRWLIDHNHIAPGFVDTRSITELQPDDLTGYTQVHFFAGIGGWSLAARLAGWPDERPLWTGSCPCQPFSVAGKGAGTADERHLWPDFHRLIRACRPTVVMGEQVAGAAGYGWFDGVAADLARENYASRYVDIPACAVDAPHIRSRLYWIAVEHPARIGRGEGRPEPEFRSGRAAVAGADAPEPLATPQSQHGGRDEPRRGSQGRAADGRADAGSRDAGNLGNAIGARLEGQRGHGDRGAGWPQPDRPTAAPNGSFWADAEWITCHDGKARRTQPGLPMLVDGAAAGLADVLRGIVRTAKEGALDHANNHRDAAEAVRMVRGEDGAETLFQRCIGMRFELPSAAFLLDFLLNVEAALDAPEHRSGGAKARHEDGGAGMRGLRGVVAAVRSSHRRQPEEQSAVESADALHGLPFLLARCAEASWLATDRANAGTISLPAIKSGRVAAWRGFGNAINPVLAAEVIGAFLDVETCE